MKTEHNLKNCTGCGSPADGEGPTPNACTHCPPSQCSDCGGINHLAHDLACSCWISIEDLPLADIKAIFAADGTFNVTSDGELRTA